MKIYVIQDVEVNFSSFIGESEAAKLFISQSVTFFTPIEEVSVDLGNV